MLKGAITALVTPFMENGLDEQAFQDHVEWQIGSGIHGLVPCGTTGESATLGHEEHKRVIRLCVEVAAGRVPVVAGAGSNETSVSIDYARVAKDCGADAALIVTPYYNKPSQEGIYRHFEAISDAVDLPLVVYNIPGRSVVDITNETMGRLSQLPHVFACKDATGDVARVQGLTDRCGADFIQLSGDDPTGLGHFVHGGRGTISVGSNIAPKQYAAFHDAMMQGDYDRARQLNATLDRLHKDLFLDPSPAPAKYALSLLGRMAPDVRLPITPCREETKERVRSAMVRAGIAF
ncbi:4-hydroxy-tetrahydrodipicolinate synthase [uncultured Algimonas sp.]|uniref:4-hydroxy-tetrahydrodipicolinate synthase n=1 Tax=uncultured Algimonas sp. TaxID=1547920 RepID=UPI002605A6AE|nr:4-hydroxy-tetrahydrodipicolinate synthase [uncultured Algimonas sp.]